MLGHPTGGRANQRAAACTDAQLRMKRNRKQQQQEEVICLLTDDEGDGEPAPAAAHAGPKRPAAKRQRGGAVAKQPAAAAKRQVSKPMVGPKLCLHARAKACSHTHMRPSASHCTLMQMLGGSSTKPHHAKFGHNSTIMQAAACCTLRPQCAAGLACASVRISSAGLMLDCSKPCALPHGQLGCRLQSWTRRSPPTIHMHSWLPAC